MAKCADILVEGIANGMTPENAAASLLAPSRWDRNVFGPARDLQTAYKQFLIGAISVGELYYLASDLASGADAIADLASRISQGYGKAATVEDVPEGGIEPATPDEIPVVIEGLQEVHDDPSRFIHGLTPEQQVELERAYQEDPPEDVEDFWKRFVTPAVAKAPKTRAWTDPFAGLSPEEAARAARYQASGFSVEKAIEMATPTKVLKRALAQLAAERGEPAQKVAPPAPLPAPGPGEAAGVTREPPSRLPDKAGATVAGVPFAEPQPLAAPPPQPAPARTQLLQRQSEADAVAALRKLGHPAKAAKWAVAQAVIAGAAEAGDLVRVASGLLRSRK